MTRKGTTQNHRNLPSLILVMLTATALSSSAAERMVLGEFWNMGGCGGFASAGATVGDLIDYFPNHIAVVEHHLTDEATTEWSVARYEFYIPDYEHSYLPWFHLDGLFEAYPYYTYYQKFMQRRAVPTPVTMQVGAAPATGNDYYVYIRTCLEPDAAPLTLRTYAVIVEDHWPPGATFFRNTFRAATETSDIVLEPGTCHLEIRLLTIDPSWVPDELRIIAWAQVPAAHGPAEVFQAAKDVWPFEAVITPGDLGCDGGVDFDDINPFVLVISNPDGWQAAYPGCPIANGDLNGDTVVNLGDVNAFIALLGGGAELTIDLNRLINDALSDQEEADF